MAIGCSCERCGESPIGVSHDYCIYCSKHLCHKCMTSGKCYRSADGTHLSSAQDEMEAEGLDTPDNISGG